ncbi:hypothetical protein M407DRAFT_32203 [Tulasnella calospora MUT 4182]|uniref:Uncharacterized protein n=1 Tax=Tulasnella calospora MUT 4182 TaxID=1051891 RepID=A0A0C3Q569_9AGAM|nr:hypothetical protein M407DRAFT_32203 [Tulasnella calospora MUT 4182]
MLEGDRERRTRLEAKCSAEDKYVLFDCDEEPISPEILSLLASISGSANVFQKFAAAIDDRQSLVIWTTDAILLAPGHQSGNDHSLLFDVRSSAYIMQVEDYFHGLRPLSITFTLPHALTTYSALLLQSSFLMIGIGNLTPLSNISSALPAGVWAPVRAGDWEAITIDMPVSLGYANGKDNRWGQDQEHRVARIRIPAGR